MKTNIKIKTNISVYILTMILFFSVKTYATVITSTSSGGNWSSAETWLGGVPPSGTDDVVIATTSGNSVTLNSNASCASLTIDINATLTNSNKRLEITGDFTINGTYTVPNDIPLFSFGTLINNGTFSIGHDANNVIGNIINNGTFTAGHDLSLTGNMQNNGTFDMNHSLSVSGIADYSTNPNTVNYYYNAGQNLLTTDYYNLVISDNGITSMTGDIIIKNDLTISGGTFDCKNFDINIGGDWINNSIYTCGSGTVTFDGTSSVQSIGGSSVTTFKDLIINNTNTDLNNVELDINNTKVTGSLTLSAGALNLNSNTLIIDNNSAAAITRTNGYIFGETYDNGSQNGINTIHNPCYSKVQWNIGTASSGTFTIPFGKSSGIPTFFSVQITSAGNAASGNITVSTYSTDNSTNYPYPSYPYDVKDLNDISGNDNSYDVLDRFWSVAFIGYSSNPTVALSFNYDPAELTAGLEASVLQAQSWDGSQWIKPVIGSHYSNSDYFVDNVSGVNSSRAWTLLRGDNPLPIELLSFNAEYDGKNVRLYWATSSETNNDFFTVEKSADGIDFIEAGYVEGAGNSNSVIEYSFTDENPFTLTYYRLKQTDFDGACTYSQIIGVSSQTASSIVDITVLDDKVNITINNSVAGPLLINIYNTAGSLVYNSVAHVNAGSSTLCFSPGLPDNDIYIVSVGVNDQEPVSSKIKLY